jgi:hypothetical protein
MKFQVIFTFEPEYEGYVTKVLDEAIENIKDAIGGYLHVPAKRGVVTVARLLPSLLTRL